MMWTSWAPSWIVHVEGEDTELFQLEVAMNAEPSLVVVVADGWIHVGVYCDAM